VTEETAWPSKRRAWLTIALVALTAALVAAIINLLEARDVRLGFPHSSGIKGSRHNHMRDMTLAELRQARQLTQQTLSSTRRAGQAAVAKMEKRTDMYVGNLRRFVEAMGGELNIVARFPEGSVKISNFAEI
jgi:hypothetical protein